MIYNAGLLLFGALSSGTVGAQSCDADLENTIAVGIHNELSLKLSIPDNALHAFVNAMKYMDLSAPQTINDADPNTQTTLFNTLINLTPTEGGNSVSFDANGEYLWYYPQEGQLGWRAGGEYDAGVSQLGMYEYNPINGEAGDLVDEYAYDPRIRAWYVDTKDKCSVDMLGTWSCDTHWTDFYTWAGVDGTVIGMSAAIGFANETSFAGVCSVDFTSKFIDDLLVDATSGSDTTISYIMDREGKLISSSNGVENVDENGALIDATNCDDDVIADSAEEIIDNHYRADQTIVWGTKVLTVNNFIQDDLHWYIVVVEDYTETDDCETQLAHDTLAIAKGDVDAYLEKAQELGNLIASSFLLGVVDSYGSPDAIDEDNGIQDYMFSAARTYTTGIRSAYVGWEDGTFLVYGTMDNGRFSSVSHRARDGSADTKRKYYYVSEDTGRSTSGVYDEKNYDPRTRPWYEQAKAEGSGLYSAPFVFATGGELGITYAVPFYDGSTLMGVVGMDLAISSIDEILETFSSSSSGIFLMETNFDILASSCNALVADSVTKARYKAYDIEDVEDYYIATAATYMNENNKFSGSFALDDMKVTLDTYEARTVEWRFAQYEVVYPSSVEDDNDDGGAAASSGDDDIETVQVLSEAMLALAVIILVFVIVAIVLIVKSTSGKPAGSGKSADSVELAPVSSSA